MDIRIFIFSLILLLAAAPSTFASEARITDLVVSKSSGDLIISANLNLDWNKNLSEALGSGVETVFVYRIKLYRTRAWLPDELIIDETVRKKVKFDNLSNEYNLQEAIGTNSRVSSVQSKDQAKFWLSKISEIKLLPLNKMDPRQDYYLKIRAHMDNFNPPVLLNYLLFFTDLREFETPVFISTPFKVK